MARGRGEGTIHRRKDGLWTAQVSLGYDAHGKRIRPTVYGKTKREVQEKLLEMQQDTLRGIPVKLDKLTVGEHFSNWLRAKKANVRSSTYLKYEAHISNYIIPNLGHAQLRDLDYRRIDALYEALDEQGLSKRTVYDIASILRSGLEDAVRKSLIPNNPARLAAKRRKGEEEARFLDQDELRRFLTALEGERLANAFILGIHTGLRPGELLGLPWDAIDLQSKTLTVKQALHEEKGRLFLAEVKTKTSRRTISLSDTAIQVLKRQRKLQAEEQLGAGGTWQNESNLVFTNREGGPLRRTNIARRDMKRVLKKAELEGVTMHTFRHTHASLLIFQGVDIKTVSRRLGHKNITITLQTYGHLLPGQDERAAEQMDKFFSSL